MIPQTICGLCDALYVKLEYLIVFVAYIPTSHRRDDRYACNEKLHRVCLLLLEDLDLGRILSVPRGHGVPEKNVLLDRTGHLSLSLHSRRFGVRVLRHELEFRRVLLRLGRMRTLGRGSPRFGHRRRQPREEVSPEARGEVVLCLGALEHAAPAQVEGEGRGVREGEHADRDESDGSEAHLDYSLGEAEMTKVRKP